MQHGLSGPLGHGSHADNCGTGRWGYAVQWLHAVAHLVGTVVDAVDLVGVVGWDIFVVVHLMIGVVVVHLVVEFGWIVVHMMGEACWIVAVNLMGMISVFYLVGWVDQDTVVLYEG